MPKQDFLLHAVGALAVLAVLAVCLAFHLRCRQQQLPERHKANSDTERSDTHHRRGSPGRSRPGLPRTRSGTLPNGHMLDDAALQCDDPSPSVRISPHEVACIFLRFPRLSTLQLLAVFAGITHTAANDERGTGTSACWVLHMDARCGHSRHMHNAPSCALYPALADHGPVVIAGCIDASLHGRRNPSRLSFSPR